MLNCPGYANYHDIYIYLFIVIYFLNQFQGPQRINNSMLFHEKPEHPYNKVSQVFSTVNTLIVTTSCKRPPPVSDHFVNNCFVPQLNTVSRALS